MFVCFGLSALMKQQAEPVEPEWHSVSAGNVAVSSSDDQQERCASACFWFFLLQQLKADSSHGRWRRCRQPTSHCGAVSFIKHEVPFDIVTERVMPSGTLLHLMRQTQQTVSFPL